MQTEVISYTSTASATSAGGDAGLNRRRDGGNAAAAAARPAVGALRAGRREADKGTDAATLVVTDRHIGEALGELLLAGGPLTRTLLGAAPAALTEP